MFERGASEIDELGRGREVTVTTGDVYDGFVLLH